jgi:hypothetical protein
VSRLSRQNGILNILQPYRTPRSVTGIAFILLIYFKQLNTLLLQTSVLDSGSNRFKLIHSSVDIQRHDGLVKSQNILKINVPVRPQTKLKHRYVAISVFIEMGISGQ